MLHEPGTSTTVGPLPHSLYSIELARPGEAPTRGSGMHSQAGADLSYLRILGGLAVHGLDRFAVCRRTHGKHPARFRPNVGGIAELLLIRPLCIGSLTHKRERYRLGAEPAGQLAAISRLVSATP